jgi:hypothetical protein
MDNFYWNLNLQTYFPFFFSSLSLSSALNDTKHSLIFGHKKREVKTSQMRSGRDRLNVYFTFLHYIFIKLIINYLEHYFKKLYQIKT